MTTIARPPSSAMPTASSYELVGAPTGNCLRAAIALEAAGIHYTVRRLDLAAGEQHGGRHLALNPAGKVPVLTGGTFMPGFVLTQSNAIMLFAAERAPQMLLPGDTAARTRVHERYFQVVTDIIGPSHAAYRLGDAPGHDAMQRLAIEGVTQLERVLERTIYLAGPSFSIADIAGFTIVQSLAPHLDMTTLPHIAGWLPRVGALPAVRRGLAAFD
jgi:GST-like protein